MEKEYQQIGKKTLKDWREILKTVKEILKIGKKTWKIVRESQKFGKGSFEKIEKDLKKIGNLVSWKGNHQTLERKSWKIGKEILINWKGNLGKFKINCQIRSTVGSSYNLLTGGMISFVEHFRQKNLSDYQIKKSIWNFVHFASLLKHFR